MHPFLADHFHIRWSTLVPSAVEADIRHALAIAKQNIETICQQDPAELTYENTYGALEKANELLDRGWGRLNHLDSVNSNPAQREALNLMLPEVSDFYSSIALNARLWAALKTFGTSSAAQKLDAVRKRHVTETMNEFVLAGADLPEDQKKRVAEVDAELAKFTQEYSEHVLDSTNAWELIIEDETKLTGLPESAKAAALANARSKGIGSDEKPAWRFTLQQTSTTPVFQHLLDDDIRRQVWEGSMSVGRVGEHDNTQLVWRILELRAEKAKILGHDHFADLTLVNRMAKNGETALKFVEDLHTRVYPAATAEYKQLSAYKAAKSQQPIDDLQPWESSFWAEQQRKEHYDFDDEALRPYFPIEGVMAGMFEIASRLFGISMVEREVVYYAPGTRPADAGDDVIEVWHPEVKFYEIHDSKTGKHLGSFYTDWHPREPKRGGAWMNSLRTGAPGEPHLGLMVGNMTPAVNGKPALFTHSEVETVFHEFGHLLHGLLSDVPVKSLAGTNVPWDWVELPSQIMENFCWERETLDLFARHHETEAPIPDDLFAKMKAAQNYFGGNAFLRQLAFGKIDLELHIHLDRYRGRDLDEVDSEILAKYHAPLKTRGPSMARRFLHLFSNPTGYAAGYYSYKWSEVLDADAFTRFKKEGVLNSSTGLAFREHILSKGNSRPVDELYRAFMGRDPELDPLLVRSGLAEPVLV